MRAKMAARPSRLLKHFAALCLSCAAVTSLAQQEPANPPAEEAPLELERSEDSGELQVERAEEDAAAGDPDEIEERPRWRRRHGNAIVRFGSNAYLGQDESADAVVSILGSSTSEGEVFEAVVSVFGNTRVTGRTGDAAVAVFGDTYVNSEVRGEAIAVFGNLELGPEAEIHGDAVAVGGSVVMHPDAIVYGGMQEVSLGGDFGQLRWLRPWIEHALLFGRPLALGEGLGWAWILAFGFLACYVLIALLFGSSVEKCVQTLENRPGESAIASLLTVLLTPVVVIVLCITIVGIALVPFFGMGLFIAGLFGKAVVLAALGRRVTRFINAGPLTHIAFSVFIGGILVTGIYLIPIVGFIAYKLLGILGLGVVVYTLTLAYRKPYVPAAATPARTADNDASVSERATTQGSVETPSSDASSTALPAVPSTALPRADFWIRMAALLIDAVLIGIIASLIPGSGEIFLLALATYGALMWKIKGTTVGGIICNLQVTRVDGREIDWATAIVRALGCFLSMAAVGLGFIWIAFDPDRQGWHDKIAGTLVVRVPRGGPLV